MAVTVALDYLRGTTYFDSSMLAYGFLDKVCQFPRFDRWAFLGHSAFLGERYDQAFKSVVTGFSGGLRLDSSGKYKLLLDLPGSFMSSVSSLPLVRFLMSNSFKFTRLDIALDDYDRRISFQDVKKAGEDGAFLYLRSFKYIESSLYRGSTPVPTCYFGKSDKVFRFYDASYVHGIPADRWELQLRGFWPNSVVADYLESGSVDCLGALLTGSIDFGLSRSDWHYFDRFSWWESLCSEVGSSRLLSPPPRDKTSIKPTLDWLYDQVAPSLAVLSQGLDSSTFDSLMADICQNGTSRFKSYHRVWVDHLKQCGLSELNTYVSSSKS